MKMASAAVRAAIRANPLVVFSKTYCEKDWAGAMSFDHFTGPFCKKTKAALTEASHQFVTYEIDEGELRAVTHCARH